MEFLVLIGNRCERWTGNRKFIWSGLIFNLVDCSNRILTVLLEFIETILQAFSWVRKNNWFRAYHSYTIECMHGHALNVVANNIVVL